MTGKSSVRPGRRPPPLFPTVPCAAWLPLLGCGLRRLPLSTRGAWFFVPFGRIFFLTSFHPSINVDLTDGKPSFTRRRACGDAGLKDIQVHVRFRAEMFRRVDLKMARSEEATRHFFRECRDVWQSPCRHTIRRCMYLRPQHTSPRLVSHHPAQHVHIFRRVRHIFAPRRAKRF